jgi:hypothetical protein
MNVYQTPSQRDATLAGFFFLAIVIRWPRTVGHTP